MQPDPDFVNYVLEQLEGSGDLTHKAMFGGHGIWESGDMFALISSDSELYFKVDDKNRDEYNAAGSQQFMTMPYWSVPAQAFEDREEFRRLASDAIATGHRTARKK